MEGRRSEPFDFHLNNPGIREILRASTFVDIPLGWANGAVASAAVLHTVGRGFESLFAHHFFKEQSYLCHGGRFFSGTGPTMPYLELKDT